MENGEPVVAATDRPMKSLPGRNMRWLAGRSLGARSTAALENVLPEGGFVPSHHHDVEEVLVCVEGDGEICVAGDTFQFQAGDTIIVPAKSMHGFSNVGKQSMHVLAFFPNAEPEVTWADARYNDSWSS